MDKNYIKGDLFIITDKHIGHDFYLYPYTQQNEESTRISEEENEIKKQVTNINDICKGKLLTIYKNNLLVETYELNKSFIKEGENINVKLHKNDKAYECSIKVLGIKREDSKLRLVLGSPIVERELDRRNFFRIKLSMRIRYSVVPEGLYNSLLDVPKGCFLKTKKSITLDISAGGIKIISEDYCEENRYVLISIYLPDKIDILCKVVRVEPYKNEGKLILSMEYVNLDEIIRDRLVEFVIKNEAARIRKNKK
ncbi:PilZ domain-containing protein [Clostridium sp. 19966]|uniref:flagellar brake protein n=1 Tax=Clostridium sp. 19966 TaxID=2768166 RepID=UPI0028DD673F|nr:PilZ domain-containing protein [Clostridium sp. 19966]MDT8716273.1 PilZ domain-containing protein [Clostridium sp. 19966]